MLSHNTEGNIWEILGKAAAVSEEILDQEQCIRLYVQNAAKNAKFRSSLQRASRFTAKIAT